MREYVDISERDPRLEERSRKRLAVHAAGQQKAEAEACYVFVGGCSGNGFGGLLYVPLESGAVPLTIVGYDTATNEAVNKVLTGLNASLIILNADGDVLEPSNAKSA